MYNQKLHVQKTAAQLMFDGYEDNLIQTAKILNIKKIPFDKFGWWYMKNASGELMGDFNVHTGVDDISQLGVIKNWISNTRTEFFPDKCVSSKKVSTGEFHSSHLTREQSISVFSADMCRSLNLDYEEDMDVHGIKAFKFSGGPKLVDNGTMYPENSCYCTGECMPSGVLNVSVCRYETPVYMSFPHYLHADPFYRQQIEGLKPVKKKHEFYIGMEPAS
jgi:hypothetical protein